MIKPDFAIKIAGMRSTLELFTRRFTNNHEESLDLVQDTLLKALTKHESYQHETNLKGWLFTIMRNTFINGYRKNQRKRTSHDLTKDLYYLNVSDKNSLTSPELRFQYEDVWSNVNAIRTELLLPFKMWTSGYKYHEIAQHLRIPIGTVKNRIFNARKEIQKKLIGYQS